MRKKWLAILFIIVFCLGLAGCQSSHARRNVSPVEKGNQEEAVPVNNNQTGENSARLEVHFIDVGQGDSILVKSPSGQAMLVDAGEQEQGQRVVDYLHSQGVAKLTVLVATHPHSDHIGGLGAVLNSFAVERVYMPRVTHNTEQFRDLLTRIKSQGLKITTARAGVGIPLDGVNAEFIAPQGSGYKDLNDYSAVIKLTCGENSFLLMGDAEEASEREMLESGVNLRAEVLKVGHHGSYSSSTLAFLQAAKPQYAVIMCGKDNDYGHPHQETLERLRVMGIRVYRSDVNGNLVMKCESPSLRVEAERNDGRPDDGAGKITRAVTPVPGAAGSNIYIGNINSHKFHRPDCNTLPKKSNQIYFHSRNEALQKGYSPCGRCRP